MTMTTKSFSDLPLSMKVEEMAKVLGVSRKVAYNLARSKDFHAAVRVGGKRIVIITEKLTAWLNDNAKKTHD